MRFVITGRKRSGPPWCYYVGRHGTITTTGAKAAVIIGLAEAKTELGYWRQEARDYQWYLEKLPPRVPVAAAVLRAELIEV